MISVKIHEDDAFELLMERVAVWTKNEDIQNLYAQMYENYLYGGCFDGVEFNVMVIVDNDYINYCRVIEAGDDDFNGLLEVYKTQGLGDCSCEDVGYNWIEAVDDEDNPTMFLVRQ